MLPNGNTVPKVTLWNHSETNAWLGVPNFMSKFIKAVIRQYIYELQLLTLFSHKLHNMVDIVIIE